MRKILVSGLVLLLLLSSTLHADNLLVDPIKPEEIEPAESGQSIRGYLEGNIGGNYVP